MTDIFELVKKYKDFVNGTTGVFSFAIYILTVIAMWMIFKKAKQAGWKSIIPIYNYYILCKISGVSYWFLVVLILLLIIPIVNIIAAILIFIHFLVLNYRLSKSFHHGILFCLGLLIFNTLLLLILGFGSSKYRKI